MGFPFKKTPHKVYKSSTLQSVLVTFWYEPLKNEEFNSAFYERLDTFTMGKFGLHVERKFPNSSLQILNNKNKTRLVFGRDKVYVILDCDGYVSFDDSAFPQQVVIENVIQAANIQDKRADMLEKSLMRHQGEKLSFEEMTAFKTASEEIKVLPFKDALVRYNELSRHITSDLLLEDGLMVHLSQYFEQPTDQLVYSVEREARFFRTGHAPIDGFRRLITKEVEIARQMA